MPLLSEDLTANFNENAHVATTNSADKVRIQTQEITLHRFSGKMFAAANQLESSGRMFAVMIKNTYA